MGAIPARGRSRRNSRGPATLDSPRVRTSGRVRHSMEAGGLSCIVSLRRPRVLVCAWLTIQPCCPGAGVGLQPTTCSPAAVEAANWVVTCRRSYDKCTTSGQCSGPCQCNQIGQEGHTKAAVESRIEGPPENTSSPSSSDTESHQGAVQSAEYSCGSWSLATREGGWWCGWHGRPCTSDGSIQDTAAASWDIWNVSCRPLLLY